MRASLRECTNNYGKAPRPLSLWDHLTYFNIPKPQWLRADPSDRLMILFRNLHALFREGTVVWGHVIQANQLLFEKGTHNHPGEVVYSLADSNRVNPEYLQHVAHQLYLLKGTQPDEPELAPIADYLTNQRIRVFGLTVPSIISPSLRCRISTTLFVRTHLPNRRLCSPLLPIIVNPKEPYVAMPLPKRFWPDDLLEWWSQ